MTEPNLVLYVATYDDTATAEEDFKALKAEQSSSELIVVGAVVMDRAADGSVDVKEHGATPVVGGTALGAVGGLVVGLFAPPLLLATAVGAGIGAGIGELEKRHQEKQMGVEVEQYLPPGTSAVVVLLDDAYADRVEKTLGKASKSISKAVDSGDVDTIQAAITKAGGKIEDSIES
jgi:uncharacterized membrane protein